MAAMDRIRNIVILTGAGISAESGIDTFRGAGGLVPAWVEEVLQNSLEQKASFAYIDGIA